MWGSLSTNPKASCLLTFTTGKQSDVVHGQWLITCLCVSDDIWNALNRIHCAGLQYNNLNEDYVLFKKTKTDFGPFFIDFKDASPHQCQRCIEVLEGDICPPRWDFGCDEL